jgi:hypothetical protein
MATWDDVRRIALALPEATEVVSRDMRQWRIKDKLFVWERPLRRSDLEALGDAAPDGPILGARVEHVGAKEALLADPSGVFFTTPHFDGGRRRGLALPRPEAPGRRVPGRARRVVTRYAGRLIRAYGG